METITNLNVAGLDVVQTGQGTNLVLLHSLLSDRSVFDRVVPALAEKFRLTLPNLPAFGRSKAAGTSIEDFADKIAEMMDALDLPPTAAVLGNGFGGFIATALAVRHGERIEKLILVDTGPAFPPPAKAPLRAMADLVEADGMEAVLDVAVERMFPNDYIAANPDIIDDRKAVLRGADPALFATAARAIAEVELGDRLPDVKASTLVMVGLEDETTPPELSHALVAGIAGARLVEIPGSGHCPQVQEPRAFVDHVSAFLN